VLDLLFIKKNLDGSVEGFESHEFEDGEIGGRIPIQATAAVRTTGPPITPGLPTRALPNISRSFTRSSCLIGLDQRRQRL
jgi:hypothetical protein